MSGFGAKSPVTDDFYFETAKELETFLKNEFKDDDRKIYQVIDEAYLNEERKQRGEGLSIAGCQWARMISFFTDGRFQMRRMICSCESCEYGHFDKCKIGIDLSAPRDQIFEEELFEMDEIENLEIRDTYTFTEVGTYIGLYSSTH